MSHPRTFARWSVRQSRRRAVRSSAPGNGGPFELVQSLAREAVLVPGRLRVRLSRDPDDDKFSEAAIEGRAQDVVTGDKDLLGWKTYRRVRIITPAAFLTILRTRKKVG